MATATLTPAVGGLADEAGETLHIPVHTLRGASRVWADRLLSVFKNKPIDGIEWSMKFSASGLVGNRFLLGIPRRHWSSLDLASLSRTLAIPQRLWMQVLQDMDQASALYISFEPTPGGPDSYRLYLESLPAPAVLRRHGVLPFCVGYKWHPETGREAAVTTYRMRHLEDRQAFDAYLAPRLEALSSPVMRQVAERIIGDACQAADPSGFLFLEADEAGTARDSFTLTFRGLTLPLRRFIPDLLRLASSQALNESEVLGLLVPDEPRSLYSLGAGRARDGHDFFTVYYD